MPEKDNVADSEAPNAGSGVATGPSQGQPPLSFGQKAVGLSFNPSGDPKVNQLKALYAQIIDLLTDGSLDNGASDLGGRILGRAINEAIGAQMWAVKAVTFKD